MSIAAIIFDLLLNPLVPKETISKPKVQGYNYPESVECQGTEVRSARPRASIRPGDCTCTERSGNKGPPRLNESAGDGLEES